MVVVEHQFYKTMIQTTFFKFDSDIFYFLDDGVWTQTDETQLGKNIGIMVTQIVKKEYTEQQILEIESDENHSQFQTYWNTANTNRDLVNDDYNQFIQQIKAQQI